MATHSCIIAAGTSQIVWQCKKILHQKMNPTMSEHTRYGTGEEQRAFTISPRKNEVAGPKWKWHSVLDMSAGKSNAQCCKEYYCIGTCNISSMYQGKLDMIKPKVTRGHISILGISERKWTGIGKFNSDDHYIYYYGKESLGRNGVAFIVNKRVWNAVVGCNIKNSRKISVCFKGRPFKVTVIQVCVPTSNAK